MILANYMVEGVQTHILLMQANARIL